MFAYSFEKAQDFLYRNARLLERRLFETLFCAAPPAGVIAALRAYQNPDGGFGHGLEPDKGVPDSQPIDMEMALHTLEKIGALTDPRVHQELLAPACDFLQTITTPAGGVPFTLPSASRYPHAPWWGGAPENPPAHINPTASITGLLIKGGFQHPWIERAVEFCWAAIAASESEEFHHLMPMITFLENAPDRQRAAPELERIAKRIQKPGVVELDPQAGGYVQMPLDWAPSPNSFARPLFPVETLRQHLHALAERQLPDGGWPITWDAISPGSEMVCRGLRTIDALLTLREYQKELGEEGK